MFKLRKCLINIGSWRYLARTYSYNAAGKLLKDYDSLSVRQQLWKLDRQKYQLHPDIVYSSYLECLPHKRNDVEAKPAKQQVSHFPKRWMEDYEFYKGGEDEDGNINSTHGTANPDIPPSHVPCGGCGAKLHCASAALPGYIPMEIFEGRTEKELKTVLCQRCHFLKYYDIALDVEISPESYVQTISQIKDKFALAVIIVDLLDFPCSVWPGLQELLGSKRQVFVIGNKVDLLPRDSNRYLEHIKECLKNEVIDKYFNKLNVKYVSLVSAKTGYGIEELITQLHKIWKYKGDVYLMGCTNVGKSSLFNILVNSDYCRPQATSLIRKATTSPWPGTTLQMLKFPIYRPSEIRVYQRFRRLFSERSQKWAEEKLRREQAIATGSIKAAQLIGRVGRTFNSYEEVNDAFAMGKGFQPIMSLDERSKDIQQARWCFDTPGVMHPDQISNLLTTEELLKVEPKSIMNPRAFRLQSGLTLFLAGLGRLDLIGCSRDDVEWIKVILFCSLDLPVVIAPTDKAEMVYDKYLGTEYLGVPFGDEERLRKWPGLQVKDNKILKVKGSNLKDRLSCDITLSNAGWVGLCIPQDVECSFRAWTPYGRGVHIRDPPLLPYALRLIGSRIRNSYAYNLAKPFYFERKRK